jgi:uncharacterized protein
LKGPLFEWDDDKARENEEKHFISFEEAILIFQDEEFDYLRLDGREDGSGEVRSLAVGRMPRGQIVAVVYTMREGRRRIISARCARRTERAAYAEHLRELNGEPDD